MPEQKPEKIFADGFYIEKKEIPNAPWIKASLSLKVSEVIPFLQMHEKKSGYVNLKLMESKKGAYYLELDTWEPTKKEGRPDERDQASGNPHVATSMEYPEEDINPEDIPF